jgi:hypothetical protein
MTPVRAIVGFVLLFAVLNADAERYEDALMTLKIPPGFVGPLTIGSVENATFVQYLRPYPDRDLGTGLQIIKYEFGAALANMPEDMDRNRFNTKVRPYLTEIPIGRQGIAFDRLELDAWVDQYKSRNGRPAAERRKPWDNEDRQALLSRVKPGTSISESADMDAFAKAVEQAISPTR